MRSYPTAGTIKALKKSACLEDELEVIALAHLTEFPDCYTRLAKMEKEAKRFWNSKTPD